MTEHRLTARQVHNKWNRDLVPAVEIDPGDVVVFETQDVSGGQVEPGSPAAALANIDYERIHPLTGPVFVKGARPGDVLEGRDPGTSTRRLGLDGDLASTVHAPAAGVLETTHHALGPVRQSRDETEDGYSHPSRSVLWRHGRRASSSGDISVLPPAPYGGNMDIRHLTRGTTLFLPVQTDGGLFSTGDGHAAQGDGEVCSGIETSMEVSLRFRLRTGRLLRSPQFVTSGPLTAKYDRHGYYATTGIGEDLLEAAREATRSMVAHLVATYHLAPAEAYVLCSVAADLKISEVVNAPNWVVSSYLPLSIFRGG
jgi:acetamidase/formamidase